MRYRFYILIITLLFPLVVFAQASGGQIRRPNRVQQNERNNRSHNLPPNRVYNHEYVDMGLSVKWATCNIGASKSNELGNFYAWGETATKNNYSWKTYFDISSVGSEYNLLEDNYVLEKQHFKKYTRFGKLKLYKEDDAASVLWGNTWHTPTIEEFRELWNLSHYWVQIDGVYGMKFVASNGNYVFLPAAGGKKTEQSFDKGTTGYYWSCELHNDDYDVSELGLIWGFDKDGGGWSSAKRYFGFPIRPVTK